MKTARRLLTLAVLAVLGSLLIVVAGAPAQSGHVATKTITGSGVGAVKLGRTFTQLHNAHLIGPLRKGCELAPNTRTAVLKAPLNGSVDFTTTAGPRRVTSISITGGATARGVGIGSTLSAVKHAFPKAIVDKSTEQVFAIDLVKVSKKAGGRFQFAVDVKTHKVTLIGIPFIAFCE